MHKKWLMLFFKGIAIIWVACTSVYATLPPIRDIYQDTNQSAAVQSLQSEVDILKQQLEDAKITIKEQTLLIERLQLRRGSCLQHILKRLHLAKTTTATPSTATSFEVTPEKDWQVACELLKTTQYTEAIHAFEKFIEQHPKHIYRARAYFYLAQLTLIKGDTNQSLYYSKACLKEYPRDAIIPKVQFYIGLAYYAQQNYTMSYKTMTQLIQRYPGHPIVKEAHAHLKKLNL